MDQNKTNLRRQPRNLSLSAACAAAAALTLTLTLPLQPLHAQNRSETPPTSSESLQQLLDQLENSVERRELSNGIRLLMLRRDYSPGVALYIKFRAGGADDPADQQGMAHMLEHMLFKGTPDVGTRNYEAERPYLEMIQLWASRYDRYRRQLAAATSEAERNRLGERVETLKRRLDYLQKDARRFQISDEDSLIYSQHGQRGYNAYTSRDVTNYQVMLPANRIEVWARLEADRFANSVILRDFYTERDVVSEERRMRVDNISRSLLMERFLAAAFPGHPYGKSLIGPMETISYYNYEDARRFFDQYYVSNNMVIAAVGDIDFAQTEEIIERNFRQLRRGTLPAEPSVNLNVRHPVRVTLEREGSPALFLAWHKPQAPDPADLHLDLLREILTSGRDSRLFRRLVVEKRLAAHVGASNGFPGQRFSNLFLISVTPAPGQSYDDIEAEIVAELETIAREGVTTEELERVRSSLEADLIFGLRSTARVADLLTHYETVTGDYRNLFRIYRQLAAVEADDLRQAAQQYLRSDRRMSARLLPPESDQKSEESR